MWIRLFLSTVAVILLLCIPVVGWILLIAMFLEKKGTVNVTYALCNNCGNSWKLKQQDSKKHKKLRKLRKIYSFNSKKEQSIKN